jgi:hypothetical protein
MKTSAPATARVTISRPSGVETSTTSERLPRLSSSNIGLIGSGMPAAAL